MSRICKNIVSKSLVAIFLLSVSSSFCQDDIKATLRLDNFLNESCKTNYTEITSEAVKNILKYNVFCITQETKNIYGEKEKQVNEFIVIDNGDQVKRFERIKTNTNLPELTGYIRDDFILNNEYARIFKYY